MAKDFKTLVRMNDWEVDQKRRALGDLLKQLADLEAQLAAHEAQLLREQLSAEQAPTEAGLTYGHFAQVAIERREEFHGLIERKEEDVENAREDLRVAYLELKKFEIAEDQRETRETAELERLERADLDEIGLMGFRRKGK